MWDTESSLVEAQVLYLAGAAAIIASWQKTGFHYYKALITSTAREFPTPLPLQWAARCVSIGLLRTCTPAFI